MANLSLDKLRVEGVTYDLEQLLHSPHNPDPKTMTSTVKSSFPARNPNPQHPSEQLQELTSNIERTERTNQNTYPTPQKPGRIFTPQKTTNDLQVIPPPRPGKTNVRSSLPQAN